MERTEIEKYLESLGLYSSQMRGNDLIHNGGWYNRQGVKLGWGDLSPADLMRIAEKITGDEAFIILPEGDSHWAFQTFSRDGKWKLGTKKEWEPMLEYVVLKARWAVFPGEVHFIPSRYDHDLVPGTEIGEQRWGSRCNGLKARVLDGATLALRLGIQPVDEKKVQSWLDEMATEQQKRRETFKSQ